MKRLLTLFLGIIIMTSLFVGCQNEKYEYVSSNTVNIFYELENRGGQLDAISIGLDYSLEMTVKFSGEKEAKDAVKSINLSKMSESDYNKKKRIIEMLSFKDGAAKIYIQNVNNLRSSEIYVQTVAVYMDKNYDSSSKFVDKDGDTVNLKTVRDDYSVLVFSNLSDVEISVGGKIVCALGGVIGGEWKNSSINFSSTDGAVVFKKSYATLIWIGIGVAILVLILVFIILVKFRVFTSIKLGLAKKTDN